MRTTYLWLGAIALAVSAVYAFGATSSDVLRDFAPGLATEVLGILLTLVFVQRILDRRQMADRLRASRGAVRRAEDPLRDLANLWADIIKGGTPRLPTRPPTTYVELFRSEWASMIEGCDLTRVRYPWSGESWAESAARIIRLGRSQISGILDTYAVHLDSRFIEALDELRDDPFLAHVETLGEQIRTMKELHVEEVDREDFDLSRTGPGRGDLMRTLVRTIRFYNEYCQGESPIEELPRDFWTTASPPRPGELVADPR